MPRLSLARLTPRRLLHLPSRTVRLRLTVLYGGLFLVSGVALLAIMYLLFRHTTGVDLIVPSGARHPGPAVEQKFSQLVQRSSEDLHQRLLQAGIALAILTAVS